MPHSRHLSSGFAPCRIEWRPSRLLCGGLLAMSALAALACLRCGLPAWAAGSLAVAATVRGLHIVLLEWRRPWLDIVVAADAVHVDGEPVTAFGVAWRGPLVVADWRDGTGRAVRRAWLPDTLPADARRELRLALLRADPAREPGSVAT